MSETPITLITPGPVPGIPGDHGPGSYLVDYDVEPRTIRPVPAEPDDETATEAAEPLPNLSADLAKGEVDDSSTSTPTEAPEQQAQNEQPDPPVAQQAQAPDIATEVAHLEDEIKTLTADHQQA